MQPKPTYNVIPQPHTTGFRRHQEGQLLLEVLVAVAAAAVIMSLGGPLVVVSLRSNQVSSEKNVGYGLIQETFEAVRGATTEKWQNLFNLSEGSTNYFPQQSTGKWILTAQSGSNADVPINGITYTRTFTVQNVCRSGVAVTGITDSGGSTTACTGAGGSHDPSTQRVTATVSWPNADAITFSEYVTRWRNKACLQTSWSTGGSSGVKTCPDTTYDTATSLTTGPSLTISP